VLADAVHEGLKHVDAEDECWDVWLQPPVMSALVQWRDALDPQGFARAAAIAGQLAGGRRETPARLLAWRLPSRGYYVDSNVSVSGQRVG
jgi:type II secretory pathway component PulM